jgi:hypothetical protein
LRFVTHVGQAFAAKLLCFDNFRGSLKLAYLLSVTAGHLHCSVVDCDALSGRILPSATAVFTDRQCHLIAPSSRIHRSAEDASRHEKQRLVIVERSAGISA